MCKNMCIYTFLPYSEYIKIDQLLENLRDAKQNFRFKEKNVFQNILTEETKGLYKR